MHANTQYPTPMKDVNLKSMLTIGKTFNVKFGYSDHTLGIEVPIAAVALGAKCIEKHITLDCNMPGPDHKASLEPNELKLMIQAIRNTEKALGSKIKKPSKSEYPNIKIVRKSLVASREIKKGEIFSDKNLTAKRPGDGLSPFKITKLLGKKVLKILKRSKNQMKMRKILFITSSRADYGTLRNVILETQKRNKETYLLVTGSHLSSEFGNTIKEIKKDRIKKIIKKNILNKKFKDAKIDSYIAESVKITKDVISKKRPDVVVILGDRYELLGCAIAAMVSRVPIAHIHGGEVTMELLMILLDIRLQSYHTCTFLVMKNINKD